MAWEVSSSIRKSMGCSSFNLFTGHRIQGESGGNFCNPLRTFGDDEELNDGDDQEDDRTDDEVTGHHELSEGFDDFTGIGIQ